MLYEVITDADLLLGGILTARGAADIPYRPLDALSLALSFLSRNNFV